MDPFKDMHWTIHFIQLGRGAIIWWFLDLFTQSHIQIDRVFFGWMMHETRWSIYNWFALQNCMLFGMNWKVIGRIQFVHVIQSVCVLTNVIEGKVKVIIKLLTSKYALNTWTKSASSTRGPILIFLPNFWMRLMRHNHQEPSSEKISIYILNIKELYWLEKIKKARCRYLLGKSCSFIY